ncbi:MAG: class I tRNA ligase family protein [Candidatus Yanofskybacteria bacterium]|nr:class I tRNA ligase family protein [Candidatus Yanofskybacteria bacterium]
MADFDFPKVEEKILHFWKDRKIFERSLENRKHARRFVFFEGPPTANGKPGIHHFLGRILKDLFVRYKTMRGYLVERKAGWDTHGLPVEIEVEKELGLKNKKEIEKYGIAKFNAKAKQSIWKYKDEWERFTKRIGFWLDMSDPYITYDWKYMESLWWIISQIDKRKLLYQGHKVLPWCPRCGTALSSHEVAQGYEDVTETSVYVKFKVSKPETYDLKPNTYFLAWTTTPWTLPGNVALAVGKNIEYVLVKYGEENYIVAKNTLDKVFSSQLLTTHYSLLTIVKGKDLVGLEYQPLFNIPHLQTETAYKVYPADFVSTDEGTGIVHTAVMYGEDDYELGKKIGLPKHHTVDEQGRFTKDVKEFEGQFVKDAEPGIIDYLKIRGLLFKTEQYTHSYPFCWRCNNPLLYYAKDSWFVAMSRQRRQLLKNNGKINWVPKHLKQGRFGEFLKEVKDWAFSRERYWGTPLPIWQCQDCKEYRTVGSLEELEKYRYRGKNTYYVLRHGFSTKNGINGKRAVTASRLEHDKYELTAEGVEQVQKVADSLAADGGIDFIFSSPFLRTRQSAEIVAKKLGRKMYIDKRLKELDHGTACEGQTYMVCISSDTVLTFDTKYGDGESWRDVKIRMADIIRELDQKHENKKIMLVSHGDPIWILEGFTKNWTDEEIIKQRDTVYLKEGHLKKIDLKNFSYNERGELDMHRPHVDKIELKCSKCGNRMNRIKDVADVWFDSGAMPYAQWHYPFENKRQFGDNFPSDFISEGIDQTRGWFYTLLAVSTLLGRGTPYKNAVSYSHVLDEKGKKMSKSLGNIVDPWVVIEKFGVDAARWYFYTVNDPADPKLFSVNDIGKKLNGFIMTALNSLRFFELYEKPDNKKPRALPRAALDKTALVSKLDYWILSRLNTLVHSATGSLDNYDLTTAAREIEKFAIEDLSNWWIRRSRVHFQRPKNKDEFNQDVELLRYLLKELSKILAPFTPFLADHIYKKLDNRKESVHLEDWPKTKKKLINPELEAQMTELRDAAAHGLAQRKELGIKVRQPLASITLKKTIKFEPDLERLLMDELNVKNIFYNTEQSDTTKLDEKLTPDLIMEGYAREIMRQIQDMRKEAKYRLDEKVYAAWDTRNPKVTETIEGHKKEIAEDALLKEFSRGHNKKEVFDIEKEFELAPQAKIWLGVRSKN